MPRTIRYIHLGAWPWKRTDDCCDYAWHVSNESAHLPPPVSLASIAPPTRQCKQALQPSRMCCLYAPRARGDVCKEVDGETEVGVVEEQLYVVDVPPDCRDAREAEDDQLLIGTHREMLPNEPEGGMVSLALPYFRTH
jgi:hypothetical protein